MSEVSASGSGNGSICMLGPWDLGLFGCGVLGRMQWVEFFEVGFEN